MNTVHTDTKAIDVMISARRMTRLFRSGFALACALSIWPLSPVQSAELSDGIAMSDSDMMAHCEGIRAQKQKMQADQRAQEANLTAQIAMMNSSPDDKKMRLMAEVITHMNEQRITMDGRKAKMEEDMMQHLMQHVCMGKDSLSKCPMIHRMKDIDKKRSDPRENAEKGQASQ